MAKRRIHRHGWKREKKLETDHHYKGHVLRAMQLPKRINLNDPFTFDQGDSGTCTGNSHSWMMTRLRQKLMMRDRAIISRLFPYTNARIMEGLPPTALKDEGAQIRDVIAADVQYGYIDEALWDFKPENINALPPKSVYDAAKKNHIKDYLRVPQTKIAIEHVLAEGFPFVFGFMVPTAFMDDEMGTTGKMSSAAWHASGNEGGHAVCACGYDDLEGVLVKNSWGKWGDPRNVGCFWMPWDVVLDAAMTDDFWVVELAVEAPQLRRTA